MEIGITIDIEAPAQRVWDVWADVERWPEWTASMSQVQLLTPGPLGRGSQARIRQPGLPPAVWQVTELREGRGFVWVSTRRGARVTAYHRLDALSGATRAVLGVVFEGPLGVAFGFIGRSLTERYVAMEAAGLKARSEAAAAVHATSLPA